MRAIAFAGAFAGLILAVSGWPAASQSKDSAVVALNGWKVAKKDGTCVAVHSYEDKSDDNAANVITLGLAKGDSAELMIVSLFYEKWKNDGDEKADLFLDKRRMLAGATWKMHDKNTLVGMFTGAKTLIGEFSKAKEITLQFDPKTKAVFEFPNPSQALGALQYCVAN
jgi:hypothetical protein